MAAMLLALLTVAGPLGAGSLRLGQPEGWPQAAPLANSSGGSNECPRVSFLCIQKTGSTTMHNHILPEMAPRQGQLYTRGHMEYRQATNLAPGCAFTLLRDPVDRFLSEFAMARGPNGFELFNPTWDFHDDDLPWLYKVQRTMPVDQAMTEYLHSPRNPSRNRQTLYLLGFGRFTGCRKWFMHNQSVSRKNCRLAKEPLYPARAYNWDLQHDELLARAKQNLLSLRAFGIVDCYLESMLSIGTSLGWDRNITVKLAMVFHERWQTKSTSALGGALPQLARSNGREWDLTQRWTSSVSPEMEAEIRRVNSLDDELVRFARAQLYERGLKTCRRDSG